MHHPRTKMIVAITATVVVIGGAATGRHLLAGSTGAHAGPAAAMSAPAPTAVSSRSAGTGSPFSTAGAPAVSSGSATAAAGRAATATGGSAPSTASGLPAVAVIAVTPQVVHTATIDLRVGKGKLDAVLGSVATVAGGDGGYVDSSSVSGGTPRRSPIAGTIVVRVLDADFAQALTKVTQLGIVEDQTSHGKDVTVQIGENAASISVLQDEVALLQKKLAQATDVTTFLQIESQLTPVEQQLEKLQSAQSILQNSAALATITVHLTAPGAPVVAAPPPRPATAAGATAWRYLRHNSLAVLDGLAVGIGWALPVLVLLALAGLIALRVVRRRRPPATAA